MNADQVPIIQMNQISKRFGGVRALNNVSLTLSENEIVGLVGENGAGKSTLVKILNGIHQPDTGSICLDGQEIALKNVQDAMDKGIGLIHQELTLVNNLDVASNIFLGREPRGRFGLVDKNKLYNDAQKILDQLGMSLQANSLVGNYSIALKQMIEIAKALSQNPRILILDEPSSSLTEKETAILFDVIRALRNRGVGIIYISHRLNEITSLVDRVVVLKDGEVSGELEKNKLNSDNLIHLMVGRDLDFALDSSSIVRDKGCFKVVDIRTNTFPEHQIGFEVGKGEIVGLAGLIGAGRSELVNTIFGIEPQVSGYIMLDGQKLTISHPHDAIEQGIYLIPEDRRKQGMIADMNITENITIPNLQHFSTRGLILRKKERKAAQNQRQSLQIKSETLESPLWQLSGGNQQKVVLAKWLDMNPRVMIFDEPTRGIDVESKLGIYKIMRELVNSNVIVIVVSSDMEELIRICDRILVMREGALSGFLERKDFSEERIMKMAVG